jgi:hypothetical protein
LKTGLLNEEFRLWFENQAIQSPDNFEYSKIGRWSDIHCTYIFYNAEPRAEYKIESSSAELAKLPVGMAKSSEIGHSKTSLSTKVETFLNGFFCLWLKNQLKMCKITTLSSHALLEN